MKGPSAIRPMINLSNSIVGVSILAMPYCFKECGILLGGLLLFVSATLTVWSCKMVLKAAHTKSKHSFESLALAVFGNVGKLSVELSVIGLNIGTCIAFFVIIGDLAPPIVAQATGIQWSPSVLRAVVLLLLALLVAFPLSLLRNINSLSNISICSLIFYCTLIVQLVILSLTHFKQWSWWSEVNWWRWQGMMKCLPIFSLAFACHAQLFVIYAALPDVSPRLMSTVINGAISMVAIGYGLVASFGYVAFYPDGVKGDILSNFAMNFVSQFTRFAFAISVVVSFPLMIFPCRVSINSLFFSKSSMDPELHVAEPIPQKRFLLITAAIIATTLTIAILIPHVETVLALTGATMGALICYIFPSSIFLYVARSNAEYRNRARVVLVLGVCVLLLSTIVVMGTQSEGGEVEAIPGPRPKLSHDSKTNVVRGVKEQVEEPGGKVDEEKRREPPHPQPPDKEEKHDGGREKDGGEKAGDKGGEDAGVQGGKGGKLDSKERDGGGERSNEAHQNIQQQMNELHERLEKVEGENKQLKEWKKGMEQQQHQQQPTPLPGAGHQEQGHSDPKETGGNQQPTVSNGGDRGLATVTDQPRPQQQEVPEEKLEPLNNPQQNSPGNKVPRTLQEKQTANEEPPAEKLQSPNTNYPQGTNAVPTGLTQNHIAKREVREVEGKADPVQEDPGKKNVGDKKDQPDVHGDREVDSNPRGNSPGQTDGMQVVALPKNTSQDVAEHEDGQTKVLQPETVKQKPEAAVNKEAQSTQTNTGNASMVEGGTNQQKGVAGSPTAAAGPGREEGRIPSRELKNIIREGTS